MRRLSRPLCQIFQQFPNFHNEGKGREEKEDTMQETQGLQGGTAIDIHMELLSIAIALASIIQAFSFLFDLFHLPIPALLPLP